MHLDTLYWLEGWKPREHEDFDSLLMKELEKDEWILDGNMRRTLPLRLRYCDTAIYLDFSGVRCFFGTLGRVIRNRGKTRQDMGEGCPEKLDRRTWGFIFSTLRFNKKNRKYIYSCIAERKEVNLIVLKNRRQVRKYLMALQKEEKNDRA